MPLRSALIFLLWLLCGLQAALFLSYLHLQLAPIITSFEQQMAKKDHERSIQALFDEQSEIEGFTRKWAAWDETYRYMQDANSQYLKTFLNPQVFIDNQINLLALLDPHQRVIWSELYDYNHQQSLNLPHLLVDIWKARPYFLSHSSIYSLRSGTLITDLGPLFLSSAPILPSNKEGPIRGTLVAGRWLSPETIQSINDKAQINAQFWPIGSRLIPAQKEALLTSFKSDTERRLLASQDRIDMISADFDLQNEPALLLATSTDRLFTQILLELKGLVLVLSIVSALAGSLVIWRIVQRQLQLPLDRVIKQLRQTTGQLPPIPIPREGPEFYPLAQALNSAALTQHQWVQQEMQKAYTAGILTVRQDLREIFEKNLQGLHGELQRLQQTLREMPVDDIERVIAEFLSHTVTPKQQTELVGALQEANTLLCDQQRTIHLEISRLTNNIANLIALSRSHPIHYLSTKL